MPKKGEELYWEIHVDITSSEVFPHSAAERIVEVVLILQDDDFRVEPVTEVVDDDAQDCHSTQRIALRFAQQVFS